MGQLLSSLNLRGNSDIVPEIGFDIESKQKKKDKRQFHSLLFDYRCYTFSRRIRDL